MSNQRQRKIFAPLETMCSCERYLQAPMANERLPVFKKD